LRFPWGRLHATPWERSANEAAPEWPPSPWRLLRALYSVAKFRCPDLDAAVVERLLGHLASPPAFRLPPHAVAHTRHYFPDPAHRSGESGATDKVFDAFVVLPAGEPVEIRWSDVELDPEERGALATLLDNLPFLGRAESLCDASIVEENPTDREAWIQPQPEAAQVGEGTLARVLTPQVPLDLPRLLATTKEVRGEGFVEPPGSQRVRYVVPAREAPAAAAHRRRQPKPTVAVLGVSSNVLPHITASLVMCELLQKSVQGQFGRLTKGLASPTLSGHSADGARRRDQHLHAHYLALPRATTRPVPDEAEAVRQDQDQRALPNPRWIDRFVIWAPEGLGDDEVRAIVAVRELKPGTRAEAEGAKELRRVDVRLEALGSVPILGEEYQHPTRTWRSITPFITSRNVNDAMRRRYQDPDERWAAFLVQEVKREAALRGLPDVEVTTMPAAEGLRWLAFRRHRAYKGERRVGAPRGDGFTLRFADPVPGPVALGALSHFGLGLFVPAAGGSPSSEVS
jgi:CRISPR-associated protein Csb2